MSLKWIADRLALGSWTKVPNLLAARRHARQRPDEVSKVRTDPFARMVNRPTCSLALVLSVAILIGCNDSPNSMVNATINKRIKRNAKVEQTLRNALLTSTNVEVQAWREFLDKWPLSRQGQGFAWYEQLKKFQGNVSAVALIENRYTFNAILDFEIESDFQKVNFPRLRFHFAEVKRVVVPPGGVAEGGVSVSFQPDQKWFGLEDWKRLVEAHCSFSAIGITVISNAPIKNIESALSTF